MRVFLFLLCSACLCFGQEPHAELEEDPRALAEQRALAEAQQQRDEAMAQALARARQHSAGEAPRPQTRPRPEATPTYIRGKVRLESLLKTERIPAVYFDDASVHDVLGFLTEQPSLVELGVGVIVLPPRAGLDKLSAEIAGLPEPTLEIAPEPTLDDYRSSAVSPVGTVWGLG